MFCVHCGKEIENGATFCSYCGGSQEVKTEKATEENGVLSRFQALFSDNKFHLATLFFLVSTVAAALSTIASGEVPLPVLEIFIIISLFKLGNLAKSGAPLISFASPLKTIKIIVNIYSVILWVLVGIFGVCGIILAVAGSAIGVGAAEIFESVVSDFDISFFGEFLSESGGIIFTVIGIIFIVAAVICALLNVFMYGSFYKTAKSAEWTAGSGTFVLEKVESTYKWLVFTAVMSGISALFTGVSNVANLLNFVSGGFNVAFIVMILLLLKNFKNEWTNQNFVI